MRSKNILIVCWDFPPAHSIGGRRWAKLAKSLLNLGYEVNVLTNSSKESGSSPTWISKNDLSKMKLFFIKKHFLVRWLNDYTSSLSFFKIHVAQLYFSVFYKGTIFDRAIGVEKRFSSCILGIIKEKNISTVFVTGAPFNLIYYTAKLREIFPEIKIIADYRDPWINAQNYGMQALSPSRKNEELRKQNYVFEHVNYITAPNSLLLNEIKETYTGNKQSIASTLELPHAFDPDDVVVNKSLHHHHHKIRLIYGGTLYLGVDNYLNLLNESVTYLKRKRDRPEIEIEFYTVEREKRKLFLANADVVKFLQPIGDKIFNETVCADYVLILLSEHNKNYLTSKFFEFMPYSKPYLYIGPESFVSQKIENEGLGYHLKTAEDLYLILSGQKKIKALFGSNIQKYTFDAVTKEFLKNIGEV